MSTVLDQVRRYQYAIEKHPEDEHRLLRCIERLQQLDVTVRHLEETGVGRTVNALRKEPGAIGEAARALVKQWKYMVAAEERSEPEDYNSEATTNYNGHHNGNDPNGRQSSSRSDGSRNYDKSQYHNGNHNSDNKRKLEGYKEETPETKRSRHSNEDYHKVNVKQEQSSDNDDSSSGSSDSDTENSESDKSNYRETIVKKEVKSEPETSSKKHEEKRADSSIPRSKESTHKHHKSESKHSSDNSSSHKEKDKEKHKSSKHSSEKYSKEKESPKTHEDKSEKYSSKDKDRRHSSEKEKHKKSHKSSKEKSDNERNKERSSSSKEKSSHSQIEKDKKRHSSSDKKKTNENKGKSDSHKESSSRSSHRSSSSKSSSSKLREDMPKKSKSQYSEDSEDGIDCGSGASFAEALGMISPSKPKKKMSNKDTSPAGYSSITHDMTPSALLAPMAKLAPLPPIEITALPEISPNYKPMPPPKLLSHINEEEAMNAVISSKNQRTKVYSGNKTVGKVYTLYELCVQVLQEHIDSLEYTGGVPYEILKPIVDRATPEQLFMLEHYNPYLMEDTDHLWQAHCQKRFRTKQRQEMETWREMYMRCQEEQEYKLKSLTANIRMAQEVKNAPVKQTKMAYVDTVVKPPRNIARKQAIHGTARAAAASPAARVASLASAVCTGSARMAHVANANSTPAGAIFKPKKAPLMQKALQFMRGRKR